MVSRKMTDESQICRVTYDASRAGVFALSRERLSTNRPRAIMINFSHVGGIVARLEHVWANGLNRRNACRALAGFLAGSPLLRSQQDPFRDHSRVPGLNELVTAFDFEPVAYAKVPRYNYDYTAYGTDSEFTLRRNRNTRRPRHGDGSAR